MILTTFASFLLWESTRAVWRSGDNFMKWGLFFNLYMGFGDQTQDVKQDHHIDIR